MGVLTTHFELLGNYIVVRITGCSTKVAQTLVTVLYGHLLTDKRPAHNRQMRKRGHTYQLPYLRTALNKSSYIPGCLVGFF